MVSCDHESFSGDYSCHSYQVHHTPVDLESNLVMVLAFQIVCSQAAVYLSVLKPLNNEPGVKNIGCNLHVPYCLQTFGITEN